MLSLTQTFRYDPAPIASACTTTTRKKVLETLVSDEMVKLFLNKLIGIFDRTVSIGKGNKEKTENNSSEEYMIVVNADGDIGIPHGTHCPDDIVHADSVRPVDVLMSRGQSHLMNEHPGNLYFRTLVAESPYKYHRSSSKAEKANLSKGIVWAIEREGGKFLKPHHIVHREVILWKRVREVEGQRKVTSAFRIIRKRQRRRVQP